MRTHRDIVQRAAFRIGLKRAGQDLEGNVYTELLNAFQDSLLELDEEQSLDFDPTDATFVPLERAPLLISWFMYQPVFDQFDNRRNPGERLLLGLDAKRRLFAAVIGESDFVEPAAVDY